MSANLSYERKSRFAKARAEQRNDENEGEVVTNREAAEDMSQRLAHGESDLTYDKSGEGRPQNLERMMENEQNHDDDIEDQDLDVSNISVAADTVSFMRVGDEENPDFSMATDDVSTQERSSASLPTYSQATLHAGHEAAAARTTSTTSASYASFPPARTSGVAVTIQPGNQNQPHVLSARYSLPMLLVSDATSSTISQHLSSSTSQSPFQAPYKRSSQDVETQSVSSLVSDISSRATSLVSNTSPTKLLHRLIVAHDMNALQQHHINEKNARMHAMSYFIVCAHALRSKQLQERVDGLHVELRQGAELVRRLFSTVASHEEAMHELETALEQVDEQLRTQEDCIGDLENNLKKQRREYDEAFSKMDIQIQEQTTKIETQNATMSSLLQMRFRADLVVDIVVFLIVYRITKSSLSRTFTMGIAQFISQMVAGILWRSRGGVYAIEASEAANIADFELDRGDLDETGFGFSRLPRTIARSLLRYRAHKMRLRLLEPLIRWSMIIIGCIYLRKRAVKAGFHGDVGNWRAYFVLFGNQMSALLTTLTGNAGIDKIAKTSDKKNDQDEQKKDIENSTQSPVKPGENHGTAHVIMSTTWQVVSTAGGLVGDVMSGIKDWISKPELDSYSQESYQRSYMVSPTDSNVVSRRERRERRSNAREQTIDIELDSDSEECKKQ